MSPTALASGKDFATAPVCIGPFRFATRVPQDRIEVVKDPNYYDATKVKLDKIICRTITDASTRFNNLRSGDIDLMINVSPVDVEQLKATSNLRLIATESIGYQGITVNIGNASGLGNDPGPLAAPFAGPLAADRRVRRAFMLSIDREALTRTVFPRGLLSGVRPDQPGQPAVLGRRAGLPAAPPRSTSGSPRSGPHWTWPSAGSCTGRSSARSTRTCPSSTCTGRRTSSVSATRSARSACTATTSSS